MEFAEVVVIVVVAVVVVAVVVVVPVVTSKEPIVVFSEFTPPNTPATNSSSKNGRHCSNSGSTGSMRADKLHSRARFVKQPDPPPAPQGIFAFICLFIVTLPFATIHRAFPPRSQPLYR